MLAVTYTVQMPDKAPSDGTKVTRHSYGGYGSEVILQHSGRGQAGLGCSSAIGAKDILGRTSWTSTPLTNSRFFLHHDLDVMDLSHGCCVRELLLSL